MPLTHMVFTRGRGDRVVIGDPNNPIAVIKLGRFKGNQQVFIEIKADRSVMVNRGEIADAKAAKSRRERRDCEAVARG